MKVFLLCLVCGVLGWFARDAVKVATAAPGRTVTVQVQVPSLAVSAPQAAPKAKPVAKPAKPALPPVSEETALDRLRQTGTNVANNGLWNVHPVSTFDENHPGGAWASPLH